MDAARFKEQWRSWYGRAPPLAHLMREPHAERWLRIHSLPQSRRYPDSDSDWDELLARHNTVATELLGDGGPCVLAVARFPSGDTAPPGQLHDVPGAPALTALGSVDDTWPGAQALRRHYEDTAVWLYTAALHWRAGAYDALLRAVARDETGPVLLVSSETGRVYAPYDGGADLFFLGPEERHGARERHRAWLSSHPRGL
jgi:hypothetical protein